MNVGVQANNATVNQQLTSMSVQLRNLMQSVSDLSTFVNGQGTGLATLEAMGFSAADAQTALSMISYLNTVAAVYFGTAGQATPFNFNNALSQLWAAQ